MRSAVRGRGYERCDACRPVAAACRWRSAEYSEVRRNEAGRRAAERLVRARRACGGARNANRMLRAAASGDARAQTTGAETAASTRERAPSRTPEFFGDRAVFDVLFDTRWRRECWRVSVVRTSARYALMPAAADDCRRHAVTLRRLIFAMPVFFAAQLRPVSPMPARRARRAAMRQHSAHGAAQESTAKPTPMRTVALCAQRGRRCAGAADTRA